MDEVDVEGEEAEMKVLLRSDIDGVGKRGDIIDVSGGFARNHLLPAGKAIVASPGSRARPRPCGGRGTSAMPVTASRPRRWPAPWWAMRSPCPPGPRASACSARSRPLDIVRQVEEQTGAVIDRKDLVLDEPIKTVGEHNVRVELIGGVVFELTVDVVAEG